MMMNKTKYERREYLALELMVCVSDWNRLVVGLCCCSYCCCCCGGHQFSLVCVAGGGIGGGGGVDVGGDGDGNIGTCVGHHHSIFDFHSLAPPFQPLCSPQQFHASTYKNVS